MVKRRNRSFCRQVNDGRILLLPYRMDNSILSAWVSLLYLTVSNAITCSALLFSSLPQASFCLLLIHCYISHVQFMQTNVPSVTIHGAFFLQRVYFKIGIVIYLQYIADVKRDKFLACLTFWKTSKALHRSSEKFWSLWSWSEMLN